MFYQLFEKKYFNFNLYKTYSNEKKIDIHLKLRRTLCIQLETVKKIEKLRSLEAYEREVFRIIQLEIRKDIDKCVNEINYLREDITDPVILIEIEAAGIDGTIHETIGHGKLHPNRVELIKGLLLSNELHCLQMKRLKNRKSILFKNEYENKCEIKILLEILNALSNMIVGNYSDMYSFYKQIPIDYKYRLELKDAIDDSQIQTSKALKTGEPYSENTNPKKKRMYKSLYETRSYLTINYLKEEILDLRKLTLEEWSKKRYDYVFSSYSPYDLNYVFNFQALLKDFENYSLRKQVEVYLAIHSSIKVQLKALENWFKERKEFTEYENIVYNYNWRKLFSLLVYYDTQIAGLFLIKIKNENFYDKNIISELENKISEKIKLDKYYIEDNEPFKLHVNSSATKPALENKEHFIEDKRIYDEKNIELAWSFHPYYISSEKASIYPSDKYDPNRAEYIKFLLSLRELETVKIEALLEYNKKLRISKYEQRFDKIYVQSLCAYRTSKSLLTDEKIWNFYSMLPNDYPNREDIYTEIKKANVSLEETKDDSPDRELYDYDNYPGSRKMCLQNDEDPKPSESQSEP
jgi:hypothetical protein